MGNVGGTKVALSLFFCGLLSLLSACGGGGSDSSYYRPKPEGYTRQEYAEKFQLLDENGNEHAAIEKTSLKSPFCFLLTMMKNNIIGHCSCAHIIKGIISTNAHCIAVEEALDIQKDYIIISYRKNRPSERVMIHPVSLKYVGDEDKDDIALLSISEEHSNEIDVFPGSLSDISKVSESITVWAFDPFGMRSKYAFGAKFVPKKFTYASRKAHKGQKMISPRNTRTPPYEKWEPLDGYTAKTKERKSLLLDSKHHIFVDKDTRPIIEGNSGSLITDLGFTKALGVIHWQIPIQNGEQYDSLLDADVEVKKVKASNGREYDLTRDYTYWIFVGTAFEPVRKEHPSSFTR
ncbi:MAG: hypothetical protein HY537_11875 [Deltaproteobacteria bacterium]|nr:hypothetical protein [Deltaproteobacteria bacterium]